MLSEKKLNKPKNPISLRQSLDWDSNSCISSEAKFLNLRATESTFLQQLLLKKHSTEIQVVLILAVARWQLSAKHIIEQSQLMCQCVFKYRRNYRVFLIICKGMYENRYNATRSVLNLELVCSQVSCCLLFSLDHPKTRSRE